MARGQEMIDLLNINEGVGNTRMARSKYETYAKAILDAVPASPEGISLKDLPAAVEAHLPKEGRSQLGKVTWHTVSVKLDLEARGRIERVPGVKPQHLRRVTGAAS